MSAVAEPLSSAAQTAHCEQCGSPLAPDQAWCLECGAARTLIHKPPDWRIGAAIVGTVIVIALVGFAVAISNLTSGSTTTVTLGSTPSTAPAGARTISGWPAGLPGWTVVLYSSTSQASSRSSARRLSAAGLQVGVLNTSQHPSSSMKPGHWAVFTGRYPTADAAGIRAAALRARGYRARARLVGPLGSR